MKVLVTICRVLLGHVFTIFGLNGFFHFIPQPPPASPTAAQYMTVMSVSRIFYFVFATELVTGIVLLTDRFVPLALAVLAPVLVNILPYQSTMDPSGLPVALFATVLWAAVFFRYRNSFSKLFEAHPALEALRL